MLKELQTRDASLNKKKLRERKPSLELFVGGGAVTLLLLFFFFLFFFCGWLCCSSLHCCCSESLFFFVCLCFSQCGKLKGNCKAQIHNSAAWRALVLSFWLTVHHFKLQRTQIFQIATSEQDSRWQHRVRCVDGEPCYSHRPATVSWFWLWRFLRPQNHQGCSHILCLRSRITIENIWRVTPGVEEEYYTGGDVWRLTKWSKLLLTQPVGGRGALWVM